MQFEYIFGGRPQGGKDYESRNTEIRKSVKVEETIMDVIERRRLKCFGNLCKI